MFNSTGKLLVSKIKNSVLYEFAVGLIGLLIEPENPDGTAGEYLLALQEAVSNFEAAFNKNSKHPFTVKIKEKHEERYAIYLALKRHIGTAQKTVFNPSVVVAAHNLKRELKACDLWVNATLSYREATKVIRQILQKFAEAPFDGWVTTISLQTIVESLRVAQSEYESLKQDRIEDRGSDMTLVEAVAQKKLKEAVLLTLGAINFGALRNNVFFVSLVNDVTEMIIEANALTRAGITRSQNSDEESVANSEGTPVYE